MVTIRTIFMAVCLTAVGSLALILAGILIAVLGVVGVGFLLGLIIYQILKGIVLGVIYWLKDEPCEEL